MIAAADNWFALYVYSETEIVYRRVIGWDQEQGYVASPDTPEVKPAQAYNGLLGYRQINDAITLRGHELREKDLANSELARSNGVVYNRRRLA